MRENGGFGSCWSPLEYFFWTGVYPAFSLCLLVQSWLMRILALSILESQNLPYTLFFISIVSEKWHSSERPILMYELTKQCMA